MVFLIIGWLLCGGLLIWASSGVLFIGALGGREFSHLPFKEYWWYLPIVCFVGWLWYVLFTNAPFTVTLS